MTESEGFVPPPLGTGYLHKRAPAHWKVQYNRSIVDKVSRSSELASVA